MDLLEREVLKNSLIVLRKVFRLWVKVERRQSMKFRNAKGQMFTVGKNNEADIGGWILKGPYTAKPLAIEVKRGDFRPTHVYGADAIRFKHQCNCLRKINQEGGVGFWINDVGMLYSILMPVLMNGARVTLDLNNCVVVTRIDKLIVIERTINEFKNDFKQL